MRVRSVLDVSVGISVWLFYSSTFRDDGRIQPKTQKKKIIRKKHTAGKRWCMSTKWKHYQEEYSCFSNTCVA